MHSKISVRVARSIVACAVQKRAVISVSLNSAVVINNGENTLSCELQFPQVLYNIVCYFYMRIID